MDDGLKQRLLGAFVLVAVAVLFLPTLFEREGQRRIDSASQIPPAPTVIPREIKEPERPAGIDPAPEPEQMYQLVNEVPADNKPRKPVLDKQGVPVAWVVQVASYKTIERANKLRDQLIGDGYKAYSRTVKTAKGQVARVFVGPKVEKQRALAIKEELDRALNIDTLVFRFRP